MDLEPQKRLTNQELLELIERIRSAAGSEDEITEWVNTLEDQAPNSHVSDLIFWSDLSPEEIMERMVASSVPPLPPPGEPQCQGT
jgi:hypothetical protein